MNKSIPYTLAMVLPTMIVWLVGSFINWDFNPAHWSELFRAAISVIWMGSNILMLTTGDVQND